MASSSRGSDRRRDGQRLRRLRDTLGLTQRELAAEFRVANGALASWESGARAVPGPALTNSGERAVPGRKTRVDCRSIVLDGLYEPGDPRPAPFTAAELQALR